MDRTVLGVDGHQLGARRAPSRRDHRARRDQRLLVRERETLARDERRHRDGETGEPDDSVHHDVGALRERRERVTPRSDVAVGQRCPQRALVHGIGDRDDLRAHLPRLLDELVDRRRRAEAPHLEPVGLGRHDLEGLHSDRAGRAGDGHPRAHRPRLRRRFSWRTRLHTTRWRQEKRLSRRCR